MANDDDEDKAASDPSCEEVVCSSKQKAFRNAMMFGKGTSSFSAPSASTSGLSSENAGGEVENDADYQASIASTTSCSTTCPMDREELGAHAWPVLHTMAAHYPKKPSAEDKANAESFVKAFSWLYPCGDCAEAFRESIQKSPPRLGSREEFSVWMCQQHNEVSEKLGKPKFDCSFDALDRRWRTGDMKECRE